MYKLIEIMCNDLDVNVMDWSAAALLTYIAKLLYCTANVTFLFKKPFPIKHFFLYQFR